MLRPWPGWFRSRCCRPKAPPSAGCTRGSSSSSTTSTWCSTPSTGSSPAGRQRARAGRGRLRDRASRRTACSPSRRRAGSWPTTPRPGAGPREVAAACTTSRRTRSTRRATRCIRSCGSSKRARDRTGGGRRTATRVAMPDGTYERDAHPGARRGRRDRPRRHASARRPRARDHGRLAPRRAALRRGGHGRARDGPRLPGRDPYAAGALVRSRGEADPRADRRAGVPAVLRPASSPRGRERAAGLRQDAARDVDRRASGRRRTRHARDLLQPAPVRASAHGDGGDRGPDGRALPRAGGRDGEGGRDRPRGATPGRARGAADVLRGTSCRRRSRTPRAGSVRASTRSSSTRHRTSASGGGPPSSRPIGSPTTGSCTCSPTSPSGLYEGGGAWPCAPEDVLPPLPHNLRNTERIARVRVGLLRRRRTERRREGPPRARHRGPRLRRRGRAGATARRGPDEPRRPRGRSARPTSSC